MHKKLHTESNQCTKIENNYELCIMNYALFTKDAITHMNKAIGVDAFADKCLAEEFVVTLHMLKLPKFPHSLTTATLLLTLFESQRVHDHVGGLATDDVADSRHTRLLFSGFRIYKDRKTAILGYNNLTHLHPLHRSIHSRRIYPFLLCLYMKSEE